MLRVVFDASDKTSSGLSLHYIQYTGTIETGFQFAHILHFDSSNDSKFIQDVLKNNDKLITMVAIRKVGKGPFTSIKDF